MKFKTKTPLFEKPEINRNHLLNRKIYLVIFILNTFFSLKGQTENTHTISFKDTVINNIRKTIVSSKWEPFVLGDINKDQISDTAFVYTPAYFASMDTTISSEPILDSCINQLYFNRVRFSCRLPEFTIENSIWGTVESIDDLDSDGINEIIFQSNWFIGSQVMIYIYSFHHGSWSVLAKNRRYSEESYRNSITKMNNRKFKFNIEYFNHRKKDYLNKTITVKIVKDKKKNSALTK